MSLSFEADLQVSGPSGRIDVSNDDAGALVVTTAELRPVVQALRSGGVLPPGGIGTVSRLLADAGGTIRLRAPDRALVTLGSGAVPTIVTRVLGLQHVRVESLRGLVVALRPSLRPVVPAIATVGVAFVLAVGLRRRR